MKMIFGLISILTGFLCCIFIPTHPENLIAATIFIIYGAILLISNRLDYEEMGVPKS